MFDRKSYGGLRGFPPLRLYMSESKLLLYKKFYDFSYFLKLEKIFYLTPDWFGIVVRFYVDPSLHCMVGLCNRDGVTYVW